MLMKIGRCAYNSIFSLQVSARTKDFLPGTGRNRFMFGVHSHSRRLAFGQRVEPGSGRKRQPIAQKHTIFVLAYREIGGAHPLEQHLLGSHPPDIGIFPCVEGIGQARVVNT